MHQLASSGSVSTGSTAESSPSTSTNTCCQICSFTPASSHFGVVSCRPCAAFFRRTVVLKRRYHCYESENCNVHHGKRPMCAYCRHKKIQHVGMTVRNIRLHYDKPVLNMGKTTILRAIKLEPAPQSLLDQLVEGYREFLRKTKELYYVVNPGSLFNDHIEYKPASLPEHLIYDRSQLYFMLKMLDNHFHPFGDLEKKDKAAVFEHFQPYFTRLNMSYLSVLRFPDVPKRLVLFYGGYIDESNARHLYIQDNDADESLRSFTPLLKKFFKMTDKLRDLKVDETETAAMTGILLWREANYHFNTAKYCEQIDQITKEMVDYCKQKSNDYLSRVGLLLCCCRDLEELMILVRACVVLGEIMNDYSVPYMHQDIFKLAGSFIGLA